MKKGLYVAYVFLVVWFVLFVLAPFLFKAEYQKPAKQAELIKYWGSKYDESQLLGVQVEDKFRSIKVDLIAAVEIAATSKCGMQKAAAMKNKIVGYYTETGQAADEEQLQKWEKESECNLDDQKKTERLNMADRLKSDDDSPLVPSASATSFNIEWPLDSRRVANLKTRDTSTASGHHTHSIDLAMPFGTELKSICDGAVAEINERKLKGRVLVIQCDHGERVLYGHLSGYKVAMKDRVKAGQVVAFSGGEANSLKDEFVDEQTTGPHLHFEVWEKQGDAYVQVKLPERMLIYQDPVPTPKKEVTVYMTHYNLGVVGQNDASPCVGASGKDLCHMKKSGEHIIALTVDKRKELGVTFGSKVTVKLGNETFTASVEDEMNKRFRVGCIKKQGACIKADYACFKGGACLSGVVSISKA